MIDGVKKRLRDSFSNMYHPEKNANNVTLLVLQLKKIIV